MEHTPELRIDNIHMDEHLLSRTDGLSGLDVEMLSDDERKEPTRAVPCNS